VLFIIWRLPSRYVVQNYAGPGGAGMMQVKKSKFSKGQSRKNGRIQNQS
jgi:hypothetical protein